MLNKVTLIGNVGKAPEVRTMQNGTEVASFSLATSESWKDKNTGEKKQKTEWHNIVVFNPGIIGVIKSYVHKGSKIYLEGSLKTRKWQDKGGVDHYTTEIVLLTFNGTIKLLDNKSDNQKESKSNDTEDAVDWTPVDVNAGLDDEIPF